MAAKSKANVSCNKLFWILSLFLIIFFVIINIVDLGWSKLYIMLSSASSLLLAGIFYFRTESGYINYQFINNAVLELKKIVWPEKDDALKTAGVVLVAIFLMSLVMRLFDVLMKSLVSLMINWL